MMSRIKVNGVAYDVPAGATIVAVGDKVAIDGVLVHDGPAAGDVRVEVVTAAVPLAVHTVGPVNVTGNCGPVSTTGSVTVTGSVGGRVSTTGRVEVGGSVDGDVKTTGSVTVAGDVRGDIDTLGSVTVGTNKRKRT